MITIAQAKSRRIERICDVVLEMFDQLEYRPEKQRVLVKPNIVDAVSFREAVITDPNVVGGLILALNEIGCKSFVIGENSGFFSGSTRNFERLIKTTKYKHMARKLQHSHKVDVEIENLNFVEMENYPWPFGNHKIQLPKMLKDMEYINAAKMKTHMVTGATLTQKNQKGLLKLADKKQFHLGYGGETDLHSAIVHLSRVIQPDLALVDATRALEGSGPTTAAEGLTGVRRLDLLIAGMDMNEVDVACCKIMGLLPTEVPHVKEQPINLAEGSMSLRDTKANPPLKKPGGVLKIGNLVLHINESMCTGCQMSYSRTVRKIMFTPEFREKFQDLQEKYPRIDMYMGKGCLELLESSKTESSGNAPRIFFGSCANSVAGDLSGLHINGCPPDHGKGAEKFLSLL